MPRHVLAICGSLRAQSINRTLLLAAQKCGQEHGLEIHLYDGLGNLPIFNPDNEETPPKSVLDFRAHLAQSDAVLIASPEYAHGVTGAIKNALDWVVASGEFMQMPVVAINASSRATIAQAALIETIRTMDATIIDDACVTIVLNGKNYSTDDIINDPETARLLDQALGSLRKALDESDQKRDIA
ncbi:NADPH-dependent FMN reductase [Thalassospira lucentensis]|uniref:NADPH-dependent FMN reductase n=1 Tax=Thalassospira lucentensis TaxID=168935 RepID=UPI00399D6BCA